MNAHLSSSGLPDDFAQRMMPTIQRIARGLVRRLPQHVRIEDLVSAGNEGLVAAIGRFDPARAEGFEGYAELRIRGGMMDELRASDPLTRDQRRFARRIAAAAHTVEVRLGRAPAADEVAAELEVSLATYWQWRDLATTPVIDGSCSGRDGDSDAVAELHDPCSEPADERLGREQVKRSVANAVKALPERMRSIVELHFVEGRTLREIGVSFGVTESRICQIVRDAVDRIRASCPENVSDIALAA